MSKKFTAPKRRIERIRNRIDILVGNSEGQVDLHTAEDAKTLVRTIIDIHIVKVDGAAAESDWYFSIQRAEQSVRISAVSVSQFLDNTAAIAIIWDHAGTHDIISAVGRAPSTTVFRDLKSMRKMKENDTIEFSHIASVNAAIRVVGMITLFFKE